MQPFQHILTRTCKIQVNTLLIGHHSGGWLGGSDEGGLTLMYSEHGLQKSFESL